MDFSHRKEVKTEPNLKTRIAIVGDFDPSFKHHVATNDAISHGMVALGTQLESTCIATSDLSKSGGLQQLRSCQGIWIAES